MKKMYYLLLLFLLFGPIVWSQQIGGAPIVPYTLTVDDTVACSYGQTITATLASSQIKTVYNLRSVTNGALIDGPVQGTGGPLQFSISPYRTDSFYVEAVAPGIGVELDATDDALEINPSPDISSGDFSLVGWIKIPQTAPNFGYINTFSRPVGTTRYLQFLHFYGRLRYLSGTGSTPTANSLIGNRSIKDNKWHHFAFTRTAATNEVNIYIDGVLDASKVIPALETGLDTCFIGHVWANGQRQGQLGASIDELSFWSRPLSLTEIQDDMANGTDSTDTDLAYFYNFEEGQGNSVHDISPNNPPANSQFENADSSAVWVDGAPRYRGEMSNQVVIHFTNNPLQIVQINSSATSVCAGDSLILEAECRSFDVVSSYQWSSGQNNGAAFVPSQSAYYTVTATDALGCTDVDSIQLTVNAAPTIQLQASDTAVCQGESVILTASGADSYLWNNSVQNAQSFQPSQSAYYRVVATDSNTNCSVVDSLWLSVYSLPNISLQPSASAICAGDSVQIQAPTSLTYSWPQGLANGQNFAPDSTDDYTVIGTDANGCRDTAITTIVVNSLPQVQLQGPANNGLCFGESMTLSASGANSYSWDNGVVDGQSFTPQSAQSYTVTATDANGCQNTASIFVDVYALPAASIVPDLSLSNPNQLCPGDSLALFGAGGTSYSWSHNLSDGQAFVPQSTDSYTVTATDANGCSDTASIYVPLLTAPSPSIQATAMALCPGQSLSLTAIGADTYSWDNGLVNGQSFVPDSSRRYTVTANLNNGCNDTAQVYITVYPRPMVQANASAFSICQGEPLLLYGSGANSYSWDNNVVDGQAFYPQSNGNYLLTGTDLNGCTAMSGISITVNPTPTAAIQASANSLCESDSLTLLATGGTSYNWSHGLPNGQGFVPDSSATYTVVVTDANNCNDTASLSVTVHPYPQLAAMSSQDSICQGQMLSLSGQGATSYNWSNGVIDGQAFPIYSSQTYLLSGTSAQGCTAHDSIYIHVWPLPTAMAQASADTVCQGDSISLSGSGGQTYSWDNNVVDGLAFVLQTTTTFTLIATDANACQDTSQIEVLARALPQLSILNLNSLYCSADNSIQLEASPANGLFSGPAVSPGDSILFNQLANGSYTVNYAYTDEFGCSNELNQSFDMDNCAGLAEANRWSQLKVYPNPSHNEVYIDLSDLEQQPLQLRLYNLMGQLVLQEEQMGGRLASLSMADLPAGTYILQLQQADQQIQLTVVKQ
ncbi:hypothetical protein SapgrDRAFT_2361 [Saprospira grandis DSM 2844]|uniref:Secretion system C-terminal sorting domain-containing protein n=1 Tax=Saprospira grandis DSM 2844 TaxID=694433 RepID=J0P8Y4_9BACT|nr:LamG-like jellyroll fold domain-containing protein [Saprospira grandis]EJF54027.1 hypothetical protein SapgrDRAFT_2361 [Saprospira grandis DSM 2844]